MMGQFKVIIVGSGLSGSLLANGLAKHGVDFSLYERDSLDSERQGYQIRVGEHALVGMRACLGSESLSRVVQHIGPNAKVPIIFDKAFRQFLDLNDLPAYSRSVPIDRIVLRDIFAEPIMELGRLHYQKKFVNFQVIQEDHKEVVQILFDDGTTETCDLLVGADGSGSKINELLGLNNIKPVEGFTALLTKCDLPISLYNSVHKDLLASPIATLQDGKLMYFCAYLPSDYAMRREAGETAKLDEESSSCMLSLCWPTSLTGPIDYMSLEQRWDLITKIYQDWSPKHHQLIELCRNQRMFILNPRVGSRPSQEWRHQVATVSNPALGSPRVWLMGDAIHPMLPNRGMGGQQAMHDAAEVLPLILGLAAKSETSAGLSTQDLRNACDDYEKEMIPRAFGWVKKSGGTNFVPLDLSKITIRILLRLSSQCMPLLRFGHWLLSLLRLSSAPNDAPEFA